MPLDHRTIKPLLGNTQFKVGDEIEVNRSHFDQHLRYMDDLYLEGYEQTRELLDPFYEYELDHDFNQDLINVIFKITKIKNPTS